MKILLSALMLLSFSVSANDCAEIKKCIEVVSKLTGKKYMYDPKTIKGTLESSSNVQFTAENADTLFTYVLDLNAYSRIPTAEKDTYMIVDSRDIRYQNLPMIITDTNTPPVVTPNYDFYMMTYKFKNFKHGQVGGVANSLRPFMSRYARVIEMGDTIVIQENAAKLANFFQIIKKADRELSAEEIAKNKAREMARNKERENKFKSEEKKADIKKD